MRDDIELLCEIMSSHFGGLSSIIIRKLLINDRLPLERLYNLVLRSKEAQRYFPNNGMDKFIYFRNSMLMLIQHYCIIYKESVDKDFYLDSSENSMITFFEVNTSNILSRLRFPLYLNHVSSLLGENSRVILMEIMKYGRISTNLLISELSENIENVERSLGLLLDYDFINIHEDKDAKSDLNNDDEIHDNKNISSVFSDLLLDYSESYYTNFESERTEPEFEFDNNSTLSISALGLAPTKSKNNDFAIFEGNIKKQKLDKIKNDVISGIMNKVIYMNINALNDSIYSQILEEMVKTRYNNVLSSVIIRVMSDSKGLKKKKNDQGWTIDEINNEILDLINLNPKLKKDLDFVDESKLKNSILRVIDVLSKHTDEFISLTFSPIGTIYKLNLPKIKFLVKYKTTFEYIGQRVGILGSRIWSMMCNPHLLNANDNIKLSNIEKNNSDSGTCSSTKIVNSCIESEIKGRVYWDDATLADKCLLPNNVARNLLYSLGNERFIRTHHSDTVTIDNICGFDQVGNNQSSDSRASGIGFNTISDFNNFNMVNTISQTSLNKHGIYYSTCVTSTIKEIQQKLFRIILNILTRFKVQSDQIMGYEIRSKHLSQIEMRFFEKLTVGLSSLFYNITQIDRILLILS
ncbi:hypothetical protein FG386_003566 [Cryptosporidium ryanae]|uniref:uncharacterized protein n=1 Tax=Cryptosporidium ryanae TaxID=515981 RepID=UPI00351AA3DB|nr:hypothetical protein FG386_003566 [Cryptosporidium ryanae]